MLSVRISPLNDTQVSRPWTVELVSHDFGTDLKTVYCRGMNKTTQNQTYSDMTCSQTVFETLYDFVEEMQPDLEMCYDYCEAQGIEVTPDVDVVIDNLLA